MSNPFFENTIDLLPATKAKAGDVEANLNAVEAGFDEAKEYFDRTLRGARANPAIAEIPNAATRANKALTFDAAGNPVATVTTTEISSAQTYATNAQASATSASNSAISASASAATASAAASNANVIAVGADLLGANTIGIAAANIAAITDAPNQASAAAASASAAASSYDAFDDRYLGAKASDPALDNDGNALLVGALYFNTVAGQMRVWSGDAWVVAYLPDGTYVDLAGDQTLTGAKRGSVTADNDLSFDMSAGNNFSCTTAGSGTLTFTNITAGQSGFILLVNASNHTISAAATTKVGSTTLATISATGTYLLSYFSNSTNVYVVNSGALA